MKIKQLLITLIVLLITILAACTFNEPVLPNWETLWQIPLPDQSFKMTELIDESEYIIADTTQQGVPILSLSIKDTVEKEGIKKEDLSIKPDPETLATNIKQIEINPGTESTNPVSIHDLMGFLVLPGSNITIPPNTTITLPAQMVQFSTYSYVMVNNGKLILEFQNQTLLDIESGMQVELYDDSTNQFIGTSIFPQINAYSSVIANDSIDIGGSLISRRLRLESSIPLVAGSYPVSNSDTSGFIQTNIFISNLIVEEAIANIPAQTVTESGAESIIDRKNRVIEAVVDEGQIRLNIDNQLEVEAVVTVSLPNFEDQSGSTFSQSQTITPLSNNNNATINLNGLRMFNFKSPGMLIDSLNYEVTVTTTPGTRFTHISGLDSVIVRFDADSIFFREFEGQIDTVNFVIDTVKQEDIFDYNNFDANVSLTDLELELTIFNELGIPVDMIINIRGEHRNSDTGELENYLELDPINVNIIPGASGFPSENTILLNGANSKIVELMEILPTDIMMNGSAQIKGQGSVTINDSVWGEYEIYSPFNVFIDSIPDFKTDIETLDHLDEDIKQAIEERFQNAILELDYENGLPMATNVILFFATDTSDFFEIDTSDTNQLVIDEFHIGSGTIGSDGYVSVPFMDKISSDISEEEVKIFSNDTLYFGSKIQFPELNKSIKFRSTDEFIGTGSLKFKVYMNPEDE